MVLFEEADRRVVLHDSRRVGCLLIGTEAPASRLGFGFSELRPGQKPSLFAALACTAWPGSRPEAGPCPSLSGR